MKPETLALLNLRWHYNKAIIKNALVGRGDSKIENDLINMIVISEDLTGDLDFTAKERLEYKK